MSSRSWSERFFAWWSGPLRRLDSLASRVGLSDPPARLFALVIALVLFVLLGFAPRNAALAERVARFDVERKVAAVKAESAVAQGDTTCPEDRRIDRRVLDARRGGYGGAEVRCWLHAIDRSGRSLYSRSQLLLDVPFTATYACLLLLLVSLAVRRAQGSASRPWWWRGRRLLWLLALGMPAVDFAENVLTAALARRFAHLDAAVLESWIGFASFLTVAKWWLGTGVAVALFAVGVGALGRLAAYLFLGRVPLLVLGLLCAVALLDTSGVSTIENALITSTWEGLFAHVTLSVLTVVLVVYSLLLTWRLAPKRFGAPELSLPTHPEWHLVPLGIGIGLVPLLPLLTRLVLASTVSWSARLGATALGVAVPALPLIWIWRWSRRKSAASAEVRRARPRTGQVVVARARRAASKLGNGYVDADGHIESGHLVLLALTGLLAITYSILVSWGPGGDRLPQALVYLLLVLALLCVVLNGLTFLLDRHRVPILLALAAYTVVVHLIWPRDHVFPALAPAALEATGADEPGSPVPDDLAEMAAVAPPAGDDCAGDAAPRTPPQGVLTVVAASGGGIQASAWTARVLTGLQREIGEEFTRSIELVSAVSGGSVGAFFFLEAARHQGHFPPSDVALEPIVEAASASSLKQSALGLAGYDLRRWLLPPTVAQHRDRAWAIERAWLRSSCLLAAKIARRDHGVACPSATIEDQGLEIRLSSWPLSREQGAPIVIFNATLVDDGQQALLSNVDLSRLDCRRSETEDVVPCPSLPVHDPSLRQHFAARRLDLAPVTAARLSATFPWVTPVARAQVAGVDLPPYYFADGGYFDNFGTVAAIKWLRANASCARRARTILFLQILAFPEEPSWPPEQGSGLAYSWLGPMKALVEMRTAAQLDRNFLELRMYEEALRADGEAAGPRLVYAVLQPKLRPGFEAPLSWRLSADNKRIIQEQWQELLAGDSMAKVRRVFDAEADEQARAATLAPVAETRSGALPLVR